MPWDSVAKNLTDSNKKYPSSTYTDHVERGNDNNLPVDQICDQERCDHVRKLATKQD